MISCSHWGLYEGIDEAIAEFQDEYLKGYREWVDARRRRGKVTSLWP